MNPTEQGLGSEAPTGSTQGMRQGGLVTLLFTDLVGSTALKQSLGDYAGVAAVQEHHALVRQLLKQFPQGEEISTSGDSFFLVCVKPSDAVRFALLLQGALRKFNEGRSVPLQDRVGLHLGEVVIEEKAPGKRDLHGMQVDTCARVMSLAQAGQILMTRPVFDNARQSLKGEEIEGVSSLSWLNHGRFELKGVEEPVEICEVRAAESQALAAPTTSEKAHRVEAPGEEPVLGWRPAMGQVVPHTQWVLERKLGEGGFGEVWLGRHQKLKERRVFKFCFRADRVRSLKREMTLFRVLKERVGDHPNIVRLLEVNFEEPPFYVEEDYVESQDLANWCARLGGADRVPLETKLEIVAQVADGLQAAHDAGVIHRDVKPGNILVSEAGRGVPSAPFPLCAGGNGAERTPRTTTIAKLTDFGIGQVVSEEALKGVTKAGFTQTIVADSSSSHTGSQMYMAPELLAGKPASVRSDIYSLGVVLYQLLVGDLGRPVTTDWAKHVEDSLLRDDLQQCFAGDADERFVGAGQLAKNLRSLRGRQSALAAKQAELAARERRAYYRGVIRTAGLAVVIVAAFALLALVALKQSRRARLQAQRADRQTQLAENRAEENRRRLVQINVADGVRLLNEGQLFDALPWLVEALRLEEGRPEGEKLQRLRLGIVLHQCPKLVQVFFPDGPVNCAVFSRDGRRVATGTGAELSSLIDKRTPGQAQVWDVTTGQKVGRPIMHGGSITQLRFSPDGRQLATASADGTARMWDAATGEALTPPLQHSNSVVGVAFSPDGKLVATASHDHTARVWDVQSGQPMTEPLRHIDMVWGVDFSPDGARLATASTDGLLRLWDARHGTMLLSRKAHSAGNAGVRWKPDGSQLLTSSQDMTARLWDATTGEEIAVLNHQDTVTHAVFSPDGERVVTASSDRTARVWDARSGAPRTEPLRHGADVAYVEFSPDGQMVATASFDGTARVWDAESGRPLTPPFHQGREVRQAIFSPDGHGLLTVSDDGTARMWELAVGLPFAEFNHQLLVNRVKLAPDNRQILTASSDGTARVLDLHTGQSVGPVIRHLRGVSEAAFSPDGRSILTASYDRTARIWEASTGEPRTAPMVHRDGVVHATFSPDGRQVATASLDKTAVIWDAVTGREIFPPLAHDREVQWVAFSSDGERLVTASRDRLARVWDTATGKELLRLQGHGDWLLQALFSPDGRRILTASTDKTARLWDALSGELRATCVHAGVVRAVHFSPDGQRFVTASYDGTARLWDTESGRAITPALRHNAGVQHAIFSGDGRWVVTASWDQTIRLWDAVTGDPVSPALRLNEVARDSRLTTDGRYLVASSGPAVEVLDLSMETRPVADLMELTKLLTSQATDEQGRAIRLEAGAIRKTWEHLKASSVEPQAASPTAVRAWHRQLLAQSLQRQQRFAVQFHQDRLRGLGAVDDSLPWLRAAQDFVQSTNAGAGAEFSNTLAQSQSCIPPPEPGTASHLIDLSSYYTWSLSGQGLSEFNNPSSLPRGIQTLAGVQFDLRGMVHLNGAQSKGMGSVRPERMMGIEIRQTCRRIHFLHGTGWNAAEGTVIARYVIHSADGRHSEWPVRYGNDVRNMWLKVNDPPEHREAMRAWVGTNALTAENGVSFRLYKSVWENPWPDVPVGTIDFISTMSDCAPLLIAITVDP